MVPFAVLIVPMYKLMVAFTWVDKLVSLIVPWIFTAYGTFLLRQAFMSLPKEIEEAAMIDGASRWGILLRVAVPLVRPAHRHAGDARLPVRLEQLPVAADHHQQLGHEGRQPGPGGFAGAVRRHPHRPGDGRLDHGDPANADRVSACAALLHRRRRHQRLGRPLVVERRSVGA